MYINTKFVEDVAESKGTPEMIEFAGKVIQKISDVSSDVFNKKHPVSSNKIYHYTDINGLIGIIQHKYLWLSSTKILNDKEEGLTFLKECREYLNEIVSSEPISPAVKEHLSFYGNSGPNQKNAFIMSFVNNEVDTVKHWTRYGNNGKGYAIEFSPHHIHHFFRKRCKDKTKSGLRLKIILAPCIYNQLDLKTIINEITAEFLNDLKKNAPYDMITASALGEFFGDLQLLCKSNQFIDENEYRLAITINDRQLRTHSKDREIKQKAKEERSELIDMVPHLDSGLPKPILKLGEKWWCDDNLNTSMITSVMAGPNIDFDKLEELSGSFRHNDNLSFNSLEKSKCNLFTLK
jgi:hypothetical protein|tara:strand:+ start:2293 stop:3339 length:1047 start_codon:yes stop_codon:yes gene_type:complete